MIYFPKQTLSLLVKYDQSQSWPKKVKMKQNTPFQTSKVSRNPFFFKSHSLFLFIVFSSPKATRVLKFGRKGFPHESIINVGRNGEDINRITWSSRWNARQDKHGSSFSSSFVFCVRIFHFFIFSFFHDSFGSSFECYHSSSVRSID